MEYAQRNQKTDKAKLTQEISLVQMAKMMGNQAAIQTVPTRGNVIQREYVLNATTLRANLGCSEVDGNWEAHHIIPNSCMSKLGVGSKTHFFADTCNQAWNGIMLPNNEVDYGPHEATVQSKDHAYVVHNSGHPKYNKDVKGRITGSNVFKKRECAQSIAQSIKTYLQNNHAGAIGKAITPHPNINDFGNK